MGDFLNVVNSVGSGNVTGGHRRTLRSLASPYKITLVIAIDEHCSLMRKWNQTQYLYTDAHECELIIVLLRLVQGPDLSLANLMKKLHLVAKPILLENIVECLKRMMHNGIDSLFSLMQKVQDRLFCSDCADSLPLMTKNSVLGLFVRWLCVAFEKLGFNHVAKLYNKLRTEFREMIPTIKMHLRIDLASDYDLSNQSWLHFNAMRLSHISLNDSLEKWLPGREETEYCSSDVSNVEKYTHRQAEFFIAEQGFLLGHNEQAALSPVELQRHINDLLQSNPDFAEANFLSYMNHLRVREYCGAIDSLFHFFDHCQMSLPASTQPPPTGTAANKPPKPADDQTQLRGYRYAALNLAALHFRYGHRKEAIAALHESIRIAQQANDSVCLQHALGWLQRLGVYADGSSEISFMLNKLIVTSSDLNLHYISSLGVQAFARHNALSCLEPSLVFDFLVKSDLENSLHCLADLTTVSYAQKASLWNLYGRNDLCSLNSQMLLHLNTRATEAVYRNGEPECIVLCHLARIHAEQGLFDAANAILESTKTRFPPMTSHTQFWMLCEQQINFTKALYRGRYGLAEEAICNLASVNGFEACFCRCQLLVDKGELSQAIDLTDNLLVHCRALRTAQQPLSHLTVRTLLLKGEALCLTGNAMLATERLLEALTLATRCRLSYIVAIAKFHLASVQLQIGVAREAKKLLLPAMTVLASQGSVYDRARALFLLVRCQHILDVTPAMTRDQKQTVLNALVVQMNQVVTWFRTIKARRREKHALYYQCHLYNELGNTVERNRCALHFRQLDMEYPSSNSSHCY